MYTSDQVSRVTHPDFVRGKYGDDKFVACVRIFREDTIVTQLLFFKKLKGLEGGEEWLNCSTA